MTLEKNELIRKLICHFRYILPFLLWGKSVCYHIFVCRGCTFLVFRNHTSVPATGIYNHSFSRLCTWVIHTANVHLFTAMRVKHDVIVNRCDACFVTFRKMAHERNSVSLLGQRPRSFKQQRYQVLNLISCNKLLVQYLAVTLSFAGGKRL